MKRIVLKILVLMIILSLCIVSISAKTEDDMDKYQREIKLASEFLNSIEYNVDITNPYILYNMNGEEEAVSFELGKTGYIIVNVNDFSIPEFSIKNKSPFNDKNEKYYYNGSLAYYIKDNETFINIKTKEKIDKTKLNSIYHREKVKKDKKYENDLAKYTQILNSSVTTSSISTIELSRELKKWYISGGYCGPIAAAITLMYYDEQFNDSYVSTSNENESSLINLMIDYVTDTGGDPSNGTGYSELDNAIDGYLDDFYSSNYSIDYYNYTAQQHFSKIKWCIANEKPAIVGLDNHVTYGDHWVTAHGYLVSYDYIVVNDGWEQNDIWIWAGDQTDIDGLIYLWAPQ